MARDADQPRERSDAASALSAPLLDPAAHDPFGGGLPRPSRLFGTAKAGRGQPGAQVLSANTVRAYAADWGAFCAWCETCGVSPLPASPPVAARYLASLAGSLGRSGLRRRLAAIAHAHHRAGQPWEAEHPTITEARQGIVAGRVKAARPAAVLTSTEVERLLEACGSDLTGLRDRALLLVGFVGALRRSELVAIDREHLRFTPEGMSVLTASVERGGEGEGVTLRIPRSRDPLFCPVRTMEEWLRRTRIEYGAVFRRISAGGALEMRLSPQGVWRVLRKRAAIAQLTVRESERLSPQGLRAGFVARRLARVLGP